MNSSPIVDEKLSASYILDSSALLALVLEEPRQEYMRAVLRQGAVVNAANLAEVVARLVDYGYTDEAMDESITSLQLSIVEFQRTNAHESGLLRHTTKSAGLSVGDRACLALAREMNVPAVTADRIWATLNLGIDIQLIR
jgi:PIN domain nuclease of toxin-antitoxin system